MRTKGTNRNNECFQVGVERAPSLTRVAIPIIFFRRTRSSSLKNNNNIQQRQQFPWRKKLFLKILGMLSPPLSNGKTISPLDFSSQHRMRCFCRTVGGNWESEANSANESMWTNNDHHALTINQKAMGSPLFAKQNIHDIPGDKVNQLTAEERNESYYDVHGVPHRLHDETISFVADKMKALDAELVRIPDHAALQSAKAKNADYVHGLKIRFLRAEHYDVSRATERIVRHFEFRRQMFGDHTLGRDLLISDLTEFERRLLETGFMQLCPETDRAGRRVLTQIMRHIGAEPPPESMIRIFFFLALFASRDENSQRKGFVVVEYMVGIKVDQLFNLKERPRVPLAVKAFAAMPLRLNALHVCFDDPRLRPMFSMITSILEARDLLRMQSHYGTDVECLYSLMSFGIAPNVLPIQMDGTIHTYQHLRLLTMLIGEERGASPALDPTMRIPRQPGIDAPAQHNVLMGRGRHGKKWPGNVKLRELLEEHKETYRAGTREEKAALSSSLYDGITQSGTRFLVPCKTANGDMWVDMKRHEVCSRISHMFRNLIASER